MNGRLGNRQHQQTEKPAPQMKKFAGKPAKPIKTKLKKLCQPRSKRGNFGGYTPPLP